MNKLLGFAACVAMIAMLCGCKDNEPKPEAKADKVLDKAVEAADKGAALLDEKAADAAEVVNEDAE